jgi:hypothetical protein
MHQCYLFSCLTWKGAQFLWELLSELQLEVPDIIGIDSKPKYEDARGDFIPFIQRIRSMVALFVCTLKIILKIICHFYLLLQLSGAIFTSMIIYVTSGIPNCW